MADVFVSYVSENRAIAEMIARGLEGAGFSVWWDRHIHGGVGFRKEIDRQLRGARVVIVLWSAASLESEWVCDEAQQGLDENKLIPVRLDNVQPPLGFRQAHSLDLCGWDGDPTAAAFTKLVDSAQHFLGDVAPGSRVPPVLVPASDAPLAIRGIAKSIAVLPFTDMSEKKDQEYFADGMAEEIINLLAKVPNLLVSARTSSFYFKGKPSKISDIARELGVAHVLEGSIRRSGNRLRVTAQLVRANNGYQVWSESYNREPRDVFELQDDIANAVVQALQIKLAGGELIRQRGGTQNLEAYDLYLRAVSGYAQNTQSSLAAASEYLDQAIKLDPSYGMAWSWLAAIATFRASQGLLDVTEAYERARQFAQHALKLSPDNIDAHIALQTVYQHDWDWAAAETEGRSALAIDPTNTNALAGAGWLSLTRGRWEEAELRLRTARARDPLNTWLIFVLARVYYNAGRFADAEAMLQMLLTLAPGFMMARVNLAVTLLAGGKPEAALAIVQQDQRHGLLILSQVLRANGRYAEADAALNAQIARFGDTGAYWTAATYADRRDSDLAFHWLERACEHKDPALGLGMVGNRQFDNIANDVRYVALLRKMNLSV